MLLKTFITAVLLVSLTTVTARSIPVFLGTYTWGKNAGKGIYGSWLDLETGKLSPPSLAAEASNPSYLAIHPNGKVIYSVSEGGDKGLVAAFTISADTLILKPINQMPSGGSGPCYLSIGHRGKNLFVTNYSDGTVATLAINADGSLAGLTGSLKHTGNSLHPERQKRPHPHSINISPDNRFAFVPDLGIDKIMIYRVNQTTGNLVQNNPPHLKLKPGAGPRHFSFHPNGVFAYVINELNSTVTVFDFNSETGVLKEIQTISTLPPGYRGPNKAAHIQVHPSGKFLYGSNRGHNSIVVYRIDPVRGTLTFIEYERKNMHTPRNFAIDPTGRFCLVANRGNNRVAVFRIHQHTGALEPTGHGIDVPQPVCVRMLKDNAFDTLVNK